MPTQPPTTFRPISLAVTNDSGIGLGTSAAEIDADKPVPVISGTSYGFRSGTTIAAALNSDPQLQWGNGLSGTPQDGSWSIALNGIRSIRPGLYRLSLEVGGEPGLSLSYDVRVKAAAPYVESITIQPAGGRVPPGSVIGFDVQFSDPVRLKGEPALLTTAGTALLGSGFSVGEIQTIFPFYLQARPLPDGRRNYVSVLGFDTEAGTFESVSGGGIILSLPGHDAGPFIDGESPRLVRIHWPTGEGPAQTGDTLLIAYEFSEPVTVEGVPALSISSGGRAVYDSGAGSNILLFRYDVLDGEATARMAVRPYPVGNEEWRIVDARGYTVSTAGMADIARPLMEVRAVAVEPPPVEPPPVEPPPVEPPPVEPPPVGADTVATIIVRNPTDIATDSRFASLGYVFAEGTVPDRVHLLTEQGQVVQVDPKTYWPDGTVRHAILTYRQPAMMPKSEGSVRCSVWSSSGGYPADIDIPSSVNPVLPDVTLGGLVGPGVAGLAAVDLAIGLPAPDSTWRQGPVAVERRYIFPIVGSLRIIVDLTVHADQTWIADIQFCNDIAMGSVGGTYVYVPTIMWGEGGAQSWTAGSISHYQYQAWTYRVYSQGEPVAYSEQSMDDLIAVGAILPFSRTPATAQSIRSVLNAWMGDPTFGKPLATNGVMMAMGTTGGRADIGPMTSPGAGWVASDDPDARKVALAWAETAGAAPWRMWDAAHSEWLSVATYPAMWTDGRSLVKPTQFTEAPGWSLDISHMPDLSFVPYLTTGRRYYLDQLCAQATWCVLSCWNGPRQNGQGLVANGFTQVRGAAWGLRTIDQAAWISPAGPTKDYLVGLSDRNWAWMLSMTPQWQVWQGESYGRLPGDYAKNNSFAPWQQDYLAGSAVQAVRFGKRAPAQWLGWAKNWLVGRFFAADKGFPPWDAVAYNVAQAPKENPNLATDLFKTWADMEAGMVAANLSNNGSFAKTTNVYETWGYYSLAAMSWVDDDPTIQNAIKWLKDQDPPHIRKIEPIVDVQFNVRPKPAA